MSKSKTDAYGTLTGREMHHQRGWTWLLAPKPFDVVSSSLYIGVLVTDLSFSCDCDFTWRFAMLIVGTIVTLLSIDRLEYWFYGEETPALSAVCLLVARIILIELVARLDNFNLSPFLYLIPPFLATLYFGNRAGYVLAGLAWITYMGKLWLRIPNWYLDGRVDNNFIIFTLGLIFAITMARTVIKEKNSRVRAEQLLSELEASHQQLKAYSEQVAELATTKERNRLARDIHDTLGHYLTVINVQLEKALAFRNHNSQEADQAVREAKRLASEALQDVRRSVGALRAGDETFSFSAAMAGLIAHVRGDSLSIEVNITGSEADFSKQALIALYRAAQEGLTNIQKHARASAVLVEIHFTEAEAHLTLSDNGRGFDPALFHDLQPGQDGRYGLQGVQERLELVGGHLQVTSHPGNGTRLFVVVPKEILASSAALTRGSLSPAQGDG